MRSAQTIGVDPDQAGSGNVHAAPSDFDQRIGRFVSLLVPFNWGPRHCGQLSASAAETASAITKKSPINLASTFAPHPPDSQILRTY